MLLDLSPMCRSFVVAATMLPMLVHSILGCCWHHAHAAADIDVCEHSNADLSRQVHFHKSCSHGHQYEDGVRGANVAKFSVVEAESTDDSGCPGDDQSPCEEDRCMDFLSDATKQRIGFANWIVDLAIGQPFEFASNQLTSCVRRFVLQNPHANPSSPRARTQVWVV